ncbi:hypothetical protein ACOMHN_039144 [Nucella lapillus]
MSGSHPTNNFSHSRLLSQLRHPCLGRHANLSTFPTTPSPESSTGEEGEVEDTDFGAVLYIAAVLVFYSLGIVVMIVKYLKTERKELEEEMALESFFKGIPSKKMEHNRDAVNRVAIRAFHTLTSGAKRQNQLLVNAEATKATTPDGDKSPSLLEPKSGTSPHSEDSDSSRGDCSQSPYLLQRERSKYLPRVSLLFRDSRANDRRRTYDNIRSKSGLGPLSKKSLPSAQRSWSMASSPLHENGQPGFCLKVPSEHSDNSDGSAASTTHASPSDLSEVHTEHTDSKKHRPQNTTVKFLDEKKPRTKPSSRSGAKTRAKTSRRSSASISSSLQGPPKLKPAIKFSVDTKDHAASSICAESGVPKASSGSLVGKGSVSPGELSHPLQVRVGTEEEEGEEEGEEVGEVVVQTTVAEPPSEQRSQQQPAKGLLVSDV